MSDICCSAYPKCSHEAMKQQTVFGSDYVKALEAERDELKANLKHEDKKVFRLQTEIDRLEAEVERLQMDKTQFCAQCEGYAKDRDAWKAKVDNEYKERLGALVERDWVKAKAEKLAEVLRALFSEMKPGDIVQDRWEKFIRQAKAALEEYGK